MIVVRRIAEHDLESLFQLVGQAEKGLTTLKVSKDQLAERIENSLRAFESKNARPAGQPYIFVMEDTQADRIIGTSAIYSKVGGFEPFYAYQIEVKTKESPELGVKKDFRILHLQKIHSGPTEIGSLFLDRDYWGAGLGRLLSISRFLFMADFPDRFEKEVIAEMRGVVDETGRSPLWAALGSFFFQIEYPRADTLTSQSKKFIADLMPEHPIYVALLPQEAQDVIGKVHDNTKPALRLLESEGFEFRGVVDIFDGGPAVHCDTKNIRTISESKSLTVGQIAEQVQGDMYVVSNSNIDFRCCLTPLLIDGDQVTLSKDVADGLNTKIGDEVRIVSLKGKHK